MAVAGAIPEYDRMREVKEFEESKMGVKGLVDSGISTIPRFFIHPSHHLTTSTPSSLSIGIPIISLSGIHSPRRSQIINEIRQASRTWGFFQVVDHGIPNETVAETITAIRSFHEQPLEIRKQYYGREERACVNYATNLDLLRSKAASWADTLYVKLAPNPPDLDRIPPVCRNEVVEWTKRVRGVGETLMELLCEGLGVRPGRLKEMECLNRRALVGHCYPYCPQPDLTLGIPSHTDPTVLTVLVQNQIRGLQVKHGQEWVDVKPLPGALVVNIGDLLQIISNDFYKSGEHRVLANPFQEPRISVAVFINVPKREDADYYGPLEELLSLEKPAIYRKFKISEFKEKFFGKELAKSLIDNFKL